MIFTFLRVLRILVAIGGCGMVRCVNIDNCTTTVTCSECIRISDCNWCLDPDIKSGRCQNESTTVCSKKLFDNKLGNSIIVNITQPSQKGNKKQTSESLYGTQVWPQMVNVTLRPNKGKPLRIYMKYHQVVDYPLDIYYLKDTSKSQDEEAGNGGLRKLSRDLPKIMTSMTRNLRLGLGTFVEKPIPPFIHPSPELYNTPQAKKDCQKCVPTYSFRNLLSLNLPESFKKVAEGLNLSRNIDAPESGFDGIMQAIVCRKEIGWRNTSRKLIVYSSNAGFHIAGDGKLLGIVKPNDGCCHLDKDGFYNTSTTQDYPSIQQLNALAKKNSINLIFAVTNNVKQLYETLVENIDGASMGIQRNYNDEDVIQIIKKEYEKLTSFVKLSESKLNPNLKLTYYSRCLQSKDDLHKTNRCDKLKVNDTVEFAIDIELLQCPLNEAELNQQFRITPEGGVEEELIVNVQMNCNCECDSPKNQTYKANSTSCTEHGNLQCDQCVCHPGYTGHDCSCPTETKNCQSSVEMPLCFGRGKCECNRCHCNSTEYWGQFCECSNVTCPGKNGNVCSDNGICVCDKCQCNENWTGDDCSCQMGTENCLRETGQELCSQHGTCACNKCKCEPGYSGRYCERCNDCSTRCIELSECVMCMRNESMSIQWDQCQEKCKHNFEMVDDVQVEEYVSKEDYVRCIVNDDDDCQFMYAYENAKQVQIKIGKQKTCKLAIQVMPVVTGIITAIVVVGFTCLMIWKILTVVQDRKEYAKFEEERKRMKWQNFQSPLYHSPAVTYPNPLFRNRKTPNEHIDDFPN